MSNKQKQLVADLPAEKQKILRDYAESVYRRCLEWSQWPDNSIFAFRPIAKPQWIANCMQDALDYIDVRHTWEELELRTKVR